MRNGLAAWSITLCLSGGLLLACSGSGGSAAGTVAQTTGQGAAGGSEPATNVSAPSDGAASFNADDLCANLTADEATGILGVDVSGPTEGLRTCFYSLPDGEPFSVAMVLIDQSNAPTPEAVCETSAQLYSDVTTLSIAGHPAFAGVDVGSVHDTLAVCPPGYQLVFGGSQARDVLAALAAAFFA